VLGLADGLTFIPFIYGTARCLQTHSTPHHPLCFPSFSIATPSGIVSWFLATHLVVPSLFLKLTAGLAADPVAMPSSQPTPPSVREGSTRQMQSALIPAHGQTVYDDGSGHRIVDSRHRSRMGHVHDVTTQADHVSAPTEDAVPSWNPSAMAIRNRSASGVSSKSPNPEQHVIRRTERSKAKVVIIVGTPRPATTKSYDNVTFSQKHEEFTPPPTPRLRRLLTPDLSDLDEAPFCDCGFEASVVKYCTRCEEVINSQ
jgi:hypothetical protein